MSLIDLTEDTYRIRARLQALSKNRVVFAGVLLGLFLLSFLLPLLFAVSIGGVLSTTTSNVEVDGIFPNAYNFSTQGEALRIFNGEKFNPVPGKDFLAVMWFRLKRLPAVNDGVLLFTKYERNKASKDSPPGFALSLKRDKDAVRPQVYWRNRAGVGKWLVFSEFTVIPKNWFMLALSFHADRFLGLHAAIYEPSEKPKVVLLGGYDLGEVVVADNDADLLFGAFHENLFRGNVGPISIFRGKDIIEKLNPILREIAAAPQKIPEDLLSEDVALWMPERVPKEKEKDLGIELSAP